jgi:glycosyltransferase involved in cell wall biosynthesis
MDWKKNILRILEASALLKKKGVAFRLILAGQGYDFDAISRKSNELDLAEYVIMTGHITDPDLLNGLYCRASILTFPSMYDMASMVVREAAAMGTPSVLVKGSTVAEVIIDGINGLLCSDCSDDLCKVLEFALSDPAKLKCLGENARQTIPIPWEVIISDVVKQYERLINSYSNSNNRNISFLKTEISKIHQDSVKKRVFKKKVNV